MKKEMILRAWKDPEYRARLSTEQRAELPESPAGRALTELDAAELDAAIGGQGEQSGQVIYPKTVPLASCAVRCTRPVINSVDICTA
jgi:mersacidin/lichenicidin family type 2 lantibiotic